MVAVEEAKGLMGGETLSGPHTMQRMQGTKVRSDPESMSTTKAWGGVPKYSEV